MSQLSDNTIARISGCRSEFEVQTLLGDIQVDGFGSFTTLRTAPDDTDARAKRTELIEAVRGGKHIELAINAATWHQAKGKPNKRHLRLGGDLAARVKTFVKQPFILDHATGRSETRKGTILSAKLVQESANRASFEMGFNVVKPDAVISVLDNTLDRFSIAWNPVPGAPILCTAHGCDIRLGECNCWPGDTVTIDGKQKIVEYEFSDWTGRELSGTNFPAVDNTSIADVRAALAAELSIPTHRRTKEPTSMANFKRLAAALGLSALETDDHESAAVTAHEQTARRAQLAEQETANVRAQLATATLEKQQAETALAVATAAGSKVRVDAILAAAYKAGKLVYARDATTGAALASPREARLRRIAAEKDGIAGLELELAEMPVVVAIGQVQSEEIAEPAKPELGAPAAGPSSTTNPYFESVAAQLGLKVEDMDRFAAQNLAAGGI